MLTFTNLGKHGRLGNQLYQYAALKAAALKNGYECKIPNLNTASWHGQNCILENFNIEVDYMNAKDHKSIQNRMYVDEPVPGMFVNCFDNLKDNTDICGFFQNTKYFSDYSEQIIKELTPKIYFLEKGKKTIDKLKGNKNIVSLHIRRGDQTDGTNPIYNTFYGENPFDTNCLVGKLITQALSFFTESNILVFTGGSRTGDDTKDIQWAKNYFSDSKFIVSQTNDPMQDFTLMSLCDHNIITGPSTFAWWAAYVNPNPDKLVVAPVDFHFDGKFKLREGFYPKNWKLI
jgi:hypothetical protein